MVIFLGFKRSIILVRVDVISVSFSKKKKGLGCKMLDLDAQIPRVNINMLKTL